MLNRHARGFFTALFTPLARWLLRDARLHVLQDGHLFLLTRAQETARIIGKFLAEPRLRPGH